MGLICVMSAHVVLEHSSMILADIAFGLGSGQACSEMAILLKNIEAHFEDVVHFELVAEALFLVVSIELGTSGLVCIL